MKLNIFLTLAILQLFSCNNDSDLAEKPAQKASQDLQFQYSEEPICTSKVATDELQSFIQSEFAKDSMTGTELLVQEALLNLPQSLLTQFEQANGQIEITKEFKDNCEDSIFSCWDANNNQNPTIYISPLESDQFWAATYLQKSLLSTFAKIQYEILEKYDFQDGKPSEYENDHMENFIFVVNSYVANDMDSPNVFESSEAVYSLMFSEYFCSHASRKNLLKETPNTKNIFDEIYQNEENLNLASGRKTTTRSNSNRKFT